MAYESSPLFFGRSAFGVQFQDLGLDLDRSQQNPNLIGRKLDGAGFAKLIDFGGDRGVLVGSRVKPKTGVPPNAKQIGFVVQLARIIGLVENQQTQSRNIAL